MFAVYARVTKRLVVGPYGVEAEALRMSNRLNDRLDGDHTYVDEFPARLDRVQLVLAPEAKCAA